MSFKLPVELILKILVPQGRCFVKSVSKALYNKYQSLKPSERNQFIRVFGDSNTKVLMLYFNGSNLLPLVKIFIKTCELADVEVHLVFEDHMHQIEPNDLQRVYSGIIIATNNYFGHPGVRILEILSQWVAVLSKGFTESNYPTM